MFNKSSNCIDELEYVRTNKVGTHTGCDAVRIIESNKELWDFIMIDKPKKKTAKHDEVSFSGVVIDEIRFSVPKVSTYKLCDRLMELDPSVIVIENGPDTHNEVALMWDICPCCSGK